MTALYALIQNASFARASSNLRTGGRRSKVLDSRLRCHPNITLGPAGSSTIPFSLTYFFNNGPGCMIDLVHRILAAKAGRPTKTANPHAAVVVAKFGRHHGQRSVSFQYPRGGQHKIILRGRNHLGSFRAVSTACLETPRAS